MDARPPGPPLGLSLAVLVLGIVIAVPSGVEAAIPPIRVLSSSQPIDTPSVLRRHLSVGNYRVYELETDPGTLNPGDVSISGAGQDVSVIDSTVSETISRGSDDYTSVLAFHISRSGTYDIRFGSDTPGRVLVSKSIGDTFRSVARWIGGVLLGLVMFLAGVAMTIIGAVRRGSRRSGVSRPSIPPAWYPDPSGTARLRYWDGSQWTEHVTT